jgi:type IV pilus assembly protein PilB
MMGNEPINDYVQRIIEGAVAQAASDIHFEPYEDFFRIRYRVDGVLREADRPIAALAPRVASCLKVMARLDIAERRLPQDGRLSLLLSNGECRDIRVSSLPTAFGEKIVLRLLAPKLALALADLGLEEAQLALLRRELERPHGLVLVCGPTGSGKSATLHACMAHLNGVGLNLSSVEDPVEIVLPGINQVAVNDKAGLGFSVALRALLRQDPDVIMVGEMRDALTADIAVKAAQTGHLVLSSLHTRSAQAAMTRLMNMGVAPFNLASALVLVVSQRLLRRVCPLCSRTQGVSRTQLERLGWVGDVPHVVACREPAGCRVCHGTGYGGRIAAFELLPLSEAALQRVLDAGGAHALPAALTGLRQAGLQKAVRGETTLSEVMAMTPD